MTGDQLLDEMACLARKLQRLEAREASLRKALRVLQDRERKYRSIFDTSRDGIVLCALDGRIEDANQAYLEMHGYTLDEIREMTYQQLTPQKWWAIEDRIDETQLMVKGFSEEYEKEHIHRDGTIFPVLVRTFLVRDRQGRALRTWAHIRNITKQKRAGLVQSVLFDIAEAVGTSDTLEELSEIIRQQVGQLIDTTNFYVALYDEENDWYTFPYEVDEQDETDLNTPVRLPSSLTDYVRRTGKPLLADLATHRELIERGEAELIGAQSLVWLGAPLRTRERVIGVVAVQSYSEQTTYTPRDLELMTFVSDNIALAIERKRADEERQRLERQIQHAQKLESLGVLAGGIAHDFNNLLTGILGNSDLAVAHLPQASPVSDCLHDIREAAVRAADLCGQMLAYSGRGHFVIESVDINEIVREIGHLLEISVSKKAVIEYLLADDLPPVVADVTQIRQVLMNLITNASDALDGRAGLITITTGASDLDPASLIENRLEEQIPPGSYVWLNVRDTGSGMDDETQQKIFDPFFTTRFTGRGLGLAAVLGIIRGHNGAIRVESERETGTTFRILLPAAEALATPRRSTPARANDWEAAGTVLLIDDEEAVRDVGRRILEGTGLTVVTAANGPEAMDYLKEHADEISCVLLDLTMPLMDGEEVYGRIRQVRDDLPIVLSSGYSEHEVTSRFEGEDIAGFVHKPYFVGELVSEVQAAMGSEDRTRG